MLEVMVALVLLLVLAIYCSIVVGKKTDDRVLSLLREDSVDVPIQVRFPEDVLRAQNPASLRNT